MALIMKAFKNTHTIMAISMCKAAVASIASKTLFSKVLQVRKHYAGSLLKVIRSITKLVITERGDFGKGLHCAHSEPFFYEACYQFIHRPHTLIIDKCGKCRPIDEINDEDSDSVPHSWKCCSKCTPLTDKEIAVILDLKSDFEKDMRHVRKVLDTCDNDCPNRHYHKVVLTADENSDSQMVHYSSVELRGHSLLCFTGRVSFRGGRGGAFAPPCRRLAPPWKSA